MLRFLLLFLWLFAIFAPTALTLFVGEEQLVVNTISEEEQQESGKKDQTEEKIINDTNPDYSFLAQLFKEDLDNSNSIDFMDYMEEILLPPPEQVRAS